MKNITLIFAFIVAYTVMIVPQQEWYWLNPKPSGTAYFSASFSDVNNGTLVGANGRIVRTTDGGDTWKLQVNFNTAPLNSVSFSDANHGTAVGNTGNIVRTTDGGNTWANQVSGTTQTLNSVFFTDSNNGIAVGNSGIIRKTTDGGNTWNAVFSGTTSSLLGVYFSDANHGTIVGAAGTIRRTTDGGNTWVVQSAGTTGSFRAVHFIDNNIGTIVGTSGLIRRTTDGGLTWIIQNAGSETWTSVFFTDVNNGYLVGPSDQYFKTTDGGISWNSISLGTSFPPNYIKFFNANDGFIIGSFSIHETNDGGNSWINHQKFQNSPYFPADIFGVHTSDENSFSFISSTAGENHFFKTTDNGENWFHYFFGTNTGYLNDIYFADTNFGLVVGSGGRIFRTLDGGYSWNSELSGTTAVLNAISFSSTSIGTVVGNGGTILRTTDGGITWVSQTSGTTNSLRGVCFVNDTVGTVVGYNSTILRTTNGGLTWVSQVSQVLSNSFEDVSLVDEYYGIIIGSNGITLGTTNGGSDWISSYIGYNLYIRAITQIDQFNATIVANPIFGGGYILKTTNMGNSWELQNIIGVPLSDISSLNSGNIVTVGANGSILRVKNENIPLNNSPQFISPTPDEASTITAYTGSQINFTVSAEDTDAGDMVTFTAIGLPSGSSMILPAYGNPASSDFSWTPSSADVGNYLITFTATDNSAAAVTRSFSIEVIAQNTTPYFVYPTPDEGEIISAYTGSQINFTVSAEDIDAGDIITLTAIGLPSGSSMALPASGNPASSVFSWTPTSSEVGTYNLTFTATDNSSASATRSFILAVVELNVLPEFVSPTPECGTTLTVEEGAPINFTIAAADLNSADIIILSVSDLPAGSSMDPSLPANGNPVSSIFSWTPSSADIGNHTFVFTADDNSNDPISCSLLVEVTPIPPPPTNYCPLSQGYWKTHTNNWPASALPMMLGTLNIYNQSELLSIFNGAPRGDASIILAHQLMAAKLNVANGAPLPAEIEDAMEDADAAIGELEIPAGIKQNHPLRATMLELSTLLDNYNNQLLTPTCVQMGKSGNNELEPVTEYALFSNYPNPFNPTTKISWQSPADGHQTLKVFDVLGNEVAVLVDEFKPAGRYNLTFDANNLASGIYIYKLQAGYFVQTNKMILLR